VPTYNVVAFSFRFNVFVITRDIRDPILCSNDNMFRIEGIKKDAQVLLYEEGLTRSGNQG
jgi:hypothetical protein